MSVCVWVRESMSVGVCVCVWEREYECVWCVMGVRESMSVCVCV